MSLTKAQRIWIRAFKRKGAELKEGDRALGDLLLLHGYIMNGGISHGVLDPSPDKLEAGPPGYDYFGLHQRAAGGEAVSRQSRGERRSEEFGLLQVKTGP